MKILIDEKVDWWETVDDDSWWLFELILGFDGTHTYVHTYAHTHRVNLVLSTCDNMNCSKGTCQMIGKKPITVCDVY